MVFWLNSTKTEKSRNFSWVISIFTLFLSVHCFAQPTISLEDLDMVRVAAVSPRLTLGRPLENANHMARLAGHNELQDSAIVLFPELSLTGYSVEDQFFQNDLHRNVRQALIHLKQKSQEGKLTDKVLIVGAPIQLPDHRLINAAVVIANGKIHGMVPKTFLPNYNEFYENRWFDADPSINIKINDPSGLGKFRISSNQIFRTGPLKFGIELCEDLWGPQTPGTKLALAGAHAIFNLSASNDVVGKAQFRRDLVTQASSRLLAAYLYASSGPWESTRDLVFGGHLLAAENGKLLGESHALDRNSLNNAFRSRHLKVEIDLGLIEGERLRNKTWGQTVRNERAHGQNGTKFPVIEIAGDLPLSHIDQEDFDEISFSRPLSPTPFIPKKPSAAQEITSIQTVGLARRIQAIQESTRSYPKVIVGVSGGLDSTLALLIAFEAFNLLDLDPTEHLVGVSMPGPGTSSRTKNAAMELMRALGLPYREISITEAVSSHLKALRHDGKTQDITFENAQARERTQILMDLGNKEGGFVLGTGDLSELCLGWCTFNADHMSMYNVNASIPKTLVRHLIQSLRERYPKADSVLSTILETIISPELTGSGASGKNAQKTEDLIGPYELHDFFIYYILRFGFNPRKVLFLALRAFQDEYPPSEIVRWLEVFYQRFQSSQFKRTTAPPGVKVGTVDVSPRGSLRLPDELNCRDALSLLSNLDSWQ